MGVTGFMSTIINHPAAKSAIDESVPIIDLLMIDYNANIHVVLHKTITELNDALYYSYHSPSVWHMLIGTVDKSVPISKSQPVTNPADTISLYNQLYQTGTTYDEILQSLTPDKITKIISQQVINYTRDLINSLNKGQLKKVFISLDGIPSAAKMKEQRNRRYVGTHINNIVRDVTEKYKLKNTNIFQIDIYKYRSEICTGTEFMINIQQALFLLDMGLDIEISTVYIKEEGEKKIIHALNEEITYNNICIMSPDSDMLILSALSKIHNSCEQKQIYNFRIDYQRDIYQFIDLNKLINSLMSYYSATVAPYTVSKTNILDFLFMLFVFGNDFLPRLEPLDISQNFDFVCEICLKLSSDNIHLTTSDGLNYTYVMKFFDQINQQIVPLSVNKFMHQTYNNYYKICQQISLTEEYLATTLHNIGLKPITVDYCNYNNQAKILSDAYYKFCNFYQNNIVDKRNISRLYNDMHSNLADSYLLLVLPRILKFPGSELISTDGVNLNTMGNTTGSLSRVFFEKFIEYSNSTNNFSLIKFRIRLMPRTWDSNGFNQNRPLNPQQNRPLNPQQNRSFNPHQNRTPHQNNQSNPHQNNLSAYVNEMEKINMSLEPYRSIFRVSNIDLMSYNIVTNKITDQRMSYYDTYVKNNMSRHDINTMVLNYLTGIEWLYHYYVMGKKMDWANWYYNQSQPPLIDNIIEYIQSNSKNINKLLLENLASYTDKDMSLLDHYLYVTPNEYTGANVSPNLADVLGLIDGAGARYLNKCQIKWHEM